MATPKQPSLDAPSSEWLVYADALQQAGDPRGELIALTAAGKNPDAYVRDHAEGLLGDAAKHLASYRLLWRLCFVDEAEVVAQATAGAADAVRALLESPVASQLSVLSIAGLPEGEERIDLSEAVAVVASHGLPASCKTLELIDERAEAVSTLVSRDFDPGPNLVQFGALAPIFALPALERLTISVADPMQLELGGVDAPNLRAFTLRDLRLADTYGAQPDVVGALAAARFPKLESFELRLVEQWVANVPDDSDAYVGLGADVGGDDGPDDGDNEGTNWNDAIGELLRALKTLPLKRLALTSFESAQSLLEALQAAGLPPGLEELDLSDSSFSSDEAAWLVKNGSLVSGLKRLVLKGTVLEAGDVKALTALGPQVEYTPGGGAKYRFVVGME
jgi:hypothetical protein